MDILINIFISSLAVGFFVEVIATALSGYLTIPAGIKGIIAAGLSVLSCWILGVSGWTLVIGGFASAFIYISILRWLDRPVQIQQVMSRRLQ
jgi:hypothetical protein